MTRKGVTVPDWRVGIDVVVVDEVERSITHFGDRYLRRVYTERELDSCRKGSSLIASRLATCFAVKEATIKVLQPVDRRPDLRSIDVSRTQRGTYEVRLSGDAAHSAGAAGLGNLFVSARAVPGAAIATVIAKCAESASAASAAQN